MEGLRFDACRAAYKAERTSDGTDVCRPCDGNPERDSENKTYRERNSRFRKFLHDLPTWLTQSEHLKLQNVTKGVQRLDRKLAVLERPMGKDDPRRVWSGFVAQPVNALQSSQSCPWPKAAKHRDIFPRLVQSGAKSCSWRSARPAGTFSTHPARPLVARHSGALREEMSVFCGRHGAARQAHGILHRVSNATIAVPATTSWSAQANTGTRPCRQGSGMS